MNLKQTIYGLLSILKAIGFGRKSAFKVVNAVISMTTTLSDTRLYKFLFLNHRIVEYQQLTTKHKCQLRWQTECHYFMLTQHPC